jgi:DNA-binding MarR family transcriptional regulator
MWSRRVHPRRARRIFPPVPSTTSTLGALLRHLIELLDGDVEAVYRQGGLAYRPRFTPVMRTLGEHGPSSIREIATRAGLTHSAVSQTVAEMVQRKLVLTRPGADARERIVHLSKRGTELLPVLRSYWTATNAAAAELCGEIDADLPAILQRAIDAVEARSFRERILARHRAPRREPTPSAASAPDPRDSRVAPAASSRPSRRR